MGFPLITAHSGCEQTERDSMESVDRAVALGADAVEMDVRQVDGVLVVSHNALTAAESRGKPSLEEVFLRLKGTGLRLNCDIKEPYALYAVLNMAARHGFGPQRLILTGSVSPEQIARAPFITKAAAVFLNVEELLKLLYIHRLRGGEAARLPDLLCAPWPFLQGAAMDGEGMDSFLEMVKALGVSGINMPYKLLTPALAAALREEGIPFSLWTVNDPREMDRCIRLGAANITTLAVSAALERRRWRRGA